MSDNKWGKPIEEIIEYLADRITDLVVRVTHLEQIKLEERIEKMESFLSMEDQPPKEKGYNKTKVYFKPETEYKREDNRTQIQDWFNRFR